MACFPLIKKDNPDSPAKQILQSISVRRNGDDFRMESGPDTRFCQSDKIVKRESAGQVLLLPMDQTGREVQRLFTLNETAAATWELLAEPRTVEEIVAALQVEYDAAEDVIREETVALLEDLQAKNCVTLE